MVRQGSFYILSTAKGRCLNALIWDWSYLPGGAAGLALAEIVGEKFVQDTALLELASWL